MQIDKNTIVELLEKLGKTEQAGHASRRLPGKVDSDNPDHRNLLSELGVDLNEVTGLLGQGHGAQSGQDGQRSQGGLSGLEDELGGLGKLL